ncbi:MAG: IS91 family transposase [Gammaproteobacteria bacterium]|nr:IS91 family transposase [Gammaproteobacteria bacterium]
MSSGAFKHIIEDGLINLDSSSVSPRQWQVLHHLKACRTSALGTYQWHSDHCEKDTQWYCSCRDRHCPVCQGQAREQWVNAREKDMLPLTYHHLVFTLPHQFNGWATMHPKVIYDGLFKAVWATLSAFANPRHHLDGKLGMMCVLHTWGQQLNRHIHLHCLIPGGVLTSNQRWCNARKEGYLFPVKALSVKYRGKMLAYLSEMSKEGELFRLTPDDVVQTLHAATKKPWVVYSKPALQHANTVVKYLARYCNRVGISESRLALNDQGQVALNYLDYRSRDRKTMHCSTSELLRRFLLHVLPKGFMRLRYYGFLANSVRRKSLVVIRDSLALPAVIDKNEVTSDEIGPVCPHCHHSGMKLINLVLPARLGRVKRTR